MYHNRVAIAAISAAARAWERRILTDIKRLLPSSPIRRSDFVQRLTNHPEVLLRQIVVHRQREDL